jgi:2-polyprenyl-3-methyl-5-hydroxy-6-metoxy-1,4-benzoquinol methylase
VNKFDDVKLDVPRLLAEQRLKLQTARNLSGTSEGRTLLASWQMRFRRRVMETLVDRRIWDRLVYANASLGWFREFERYWVGELGLRPITPPDFHFLKGVYRQRFQTLVDVSDANALEEGWRDARSLYLLFHLTLRNALRPLAAREFIKWIPRRGAILEFGCGMAPISSSLTQFYRDRDLAITCADIEHVLLHYVRWKFSEETCVRTVAIDPSADDPLDQVRYDTIFCMTVLEHVPRPLQTLKCLHAHLKAGGHLVFDYIHSEGKGLDSEGGVRERSQALRYVSEHFDLVEGELHLDGRDVSRVVCRLKREEEQSAWQSQDHMVRSGTAAHWAATSSGSVGR